MKRALYLALLMLCTPAWAAPLCWPYPTPNVFAVEADEGSGWEYVAAWKCGDIPQIEFFMKLEGAAYMAAYYSGNFDTSAFAAQYNSAPRTRNVIAKAQERRLMVDLFKATPLVVDNKAYKKSTDTTGEKFVLVGTIPVGTPCVPSGRAGDMMRVDRALVQYPSPNSVKPPIAWAKCG